MTKPYVTLILGAGASYPYGFPLGKDLIELLINECDQFHILLRQNFLSPDEKSLWPQPDLLPYEIEEVRRELRQATLDLKDQLELYRPQSIDRFLGHLYSDGKNHQLVDIARLLISKIITRKYNEKSIAYPKGKDKWMEHLFNALFYCVYQKQYDLELYTIILKKKSLLTANWETTLLRKNSLLQLTDV